MTFMVLYKAFREKFLMELKKETYRECKIEGCMEPAWRNGYCYNCVSHSTNQRILLALRENNVLLKELLELEKQNKPYPLVQNETIFQSIEKEKSIISDAKRIMDEEQEEFIPTIFSNKPIGSGKKKSIEIENTDKLNSVNNIK